MSANSQHQTKEHIRYIVIRIIKLVMIIALIKWARWELYTNSNARQIIDPLIQSGQLASAFQSISITLAFIGILLLSIGFVMKRTTFLDSKYFWWIFGFLILDAAFLYVFPDVPILILKGYNSHE